MATPTSTVQQYEQPWASGMRQGYLESIANLAGQPRPIPVQQYAGLDPMEMRAREMAGGLGGFAPYIKQGGEMMQQGADYFTPAGIQQFYNPFEQDVVQQTMQDMREQNLQQGVLIEAELLVQVPLADPVAGSWDKKGRDPSAVA